MAVLRYVSQSLACLPLLPAIYWQGRSVEADIPTLPDASGLSGTCGKGHGQDFHLLLIGESTIAGVGVETHEHSIAGHLSRELHERLERPIAWNVHAGSGFTVQKINRRILPQIPNNPIDLIVIGVGANDAFKLSTLRKWRKSIRSMIEHLQKRFTDVPIVFMHTPPVKEFPVFTSLLRFSIGNLCEIFGDDLGNLVDEFKRVYFAGTKLSIHDWKERYELTCSVDDLFSDGVHPSELTYQLWSRDIAKFIQENKIICSPLR